MERGKPKHPSLRRLAVGLGVAATALAVVFCAVGIYIHVLYPAEKLEELWFYLWGSTGTGTAVIWQAFFVLFLPCLAVCALLLTMQYGFRRHPLVLRRTSRKTGKTRTIQILPVRHRALFTAITCLLLIGIGLGQLGAFSYLRLSLTGSEFFAEQYVSPKTPGRVTAPQEKRNLIFIELESFETSFFSREHGGLWEEELIPELYELFSDPDAVWFASDENTHGTLNAFGTTWTTAALIAYTSGIPFKVPVGKNNSYHAENFLSGAWSLGDILLENGYRNILVSAATTSFGGVAEYFTAHGDYTIVDVNQPYFTDESGTRTDFTIPESQTSEWGYSDEAAFQMAQAVLTAQTQSSSEPFHLLIKTTDAHMNGYLHEAGDGYEGSIRSFGTQIENVYATTSREVGAFVAWLKEQPFYESTTVVLVGDHPNMMSGICGNVESDARGRYNLILNSVVTTENRKNRAFTAFDFYPTILSAMGFQIVGNQLGLGVDLFSDQPTLAEQYGITVLNKELEKRSTFYIDRIIGREDYEALER